MTSPCAPCLAALLLFSLGLAADGKRFLLRPRIVEAHCLGWDSRVCLLLQDLLQSCSRGGRGIVEDMCYERRRAEACVTSLPITH